MKAIDSSYKGYLLLLIITAALMGFYFVLRYQLGWVETDTALLTRGILSLVNEQHLAPADALAYTNGYTYQTIGVFLSIFTGLDPVALQRWILPFAVIGIPVVFWILVCEITHSAKAACLGTLILLLQPELQFVVIRGSHEKFGRLLMILSLYLLFKTLKPVIPVSKKLYLIILFYLCMFAYLSSNFLIGLSFIAAAGTALISGLILAKFLPCGTAYSSANAKLVFVSFSLFILAFLIAFYFYTPVQSTILAADSILEKVYLLLFNPGDTVNVYQKAFNAWGSPLVYLTFNLANWIVLVASFVIWVKLGLSLIKRKTPQEDHRSPYWVLWLLYAAFGIQAVLSIISDASGMYGNLQHRIFPSLSILGVLLISVWLAQTEFSNKSSRLALTLTISALTVFSVLKFTNEPALVGWWIFFTPEEKSALEWAGANLKDTSLWVGYNERLYELNRQEIIITGNNSVLDFGEMDDESSYFLQSDSIYQQGAKFHHQLLDPSGLNLVYNNGGAAIYKSQPASAYQK